VPIAIDNKIPKDATEKLRSTAKLQPHKTPNQLKAGKLRMNMVNLSLKKNNIDVAHCAAQF
jgi:hypothetical protein